MYICLADFLGIQKSAGCYFGVLGGLTGGSVGRAGTKRTVSAWYYISNWVLGLDRCLNCWRLASTAGKWA